MDDKFIAPPAPSPAFVELLHRGHDGWIPFYTMNPGEEPQPVGAVRGFDLASWFPEFVDELTADSYHTVHGFYRPLRRRKFARWITACFSDLDCGREGTLPFGVVLGSVVELQDRGRIPPVSLFYRSGRGLWCFWILRDNDGGPVRAWWEKCLTWDRLQKAIYRRVASLCADVGSKDLARITRVLGSVNTKSGRRVAYWPQLDQHGKPFTYTLDELCRLFRVTPVPRFIEPPPPKTRRVQKALSDVRRQANLSRYAKHLERLQILQHMRGGGFAHGHRFNTCRFLASLMRTIYFDEKDIRDAVFELGHAGRSPDGSQPDPLEDKDIEAALAASHKVWGIEDNLVAAILRITPAEATAIEFRPSPAYQDTPDEDDTPPPDSYAPSPAEIETRRLAFIRSAVKNKKRPPTVRDMIALCKEYGLPANEHQVLRAYRSIGVRGRKPKTTKQASLFMPAGGHQ